MLYTHDTACHTTPHCTPPSPPPPLPLRLPTCSLMLSGEQELQTGSCGDSVRQYSAAQQRQHPQLSSAAAARMALMPLRLMPCWPQRASWAQVAGWPHPGVPSQPGVEASFCNLSVCQPVSQRLKPKLATGQRLAGTQRSTLVLPTTPAAAAHLPHTAARC